MRERMQAMNKLVKENTEKQQAKQKRWYDRTARERELSPEYKVLVLLPTSSNKLLGQWRGPYKIARRIRKVDYERVAGRQVIDYYCDKVRDKTENGSCCPVHQPPYRIPYADRSEVDKEIQDMITEGVIEPSKSDWASPMVIVRKKDNIL
uniref:Reverse transcriptase domain-containing protein n=1 Tax=Amphimedon queenslandica TaxID=400682 RepID=A0A1X7TE20_AMPQE